MTDFGRRPGEMLKSVYDTDENGVVDTVQAVPGHGTSHQNTGADEISVAGLAGELAGEQLSTWAKVSGKPSTFAPEAHKASHQFGGLDKISVLGLVGTTPYAISGDVGLNRVLRQSNLLIQNGTTDETLRLQLTNIWNGSSVDITDNCAKGAQTGAFYVHTLGYEIFIDSLYLSGIVLMCAAVLAMNASGQLMTFNGDSEEGHIHLLFRTVPDGNLIDITGLVDIGQFVVQLTYVTYT